MPRDVLIVAVLVLASLASFGLGYLAGLDSAQRSQMILETAPITSAAAVASSTNSAVRVGQVFASKNGTKYYLPGCTGGDRISDTNKVWFTSPSAAIAAGYTAATACKGL